MNLHHAGSLFDLRGKKAIVTGGGAGLGKAIVRGYHDMGAEVVIIGRSDNIYAAAEEIRDHEEKSGTGGVPVHGVKGDLGSRADVARLFSEAVEKLGTVDILVNNAGIQRRHRCEEFPIEDWDQVLEVNLTSVFEMCQLAGRVMLEKGEGKIINIASMLSFSGGYTVPAYAASKGGVAQLTKALANEWAGRGINVNAIAPGYMDTDMNTALINDPQRNTQIMARIPAGRWGKPEDLVGLAIFLASRGADYMHGAVIPVDGGYLAR